MNCCDETLEAEGQEMSGSCKLVPNVKPLKQKGSGEQSEDLCGNWSGWWLHEVLLSGLFRLHCEDG